MSTPMIQPVLALMLLTMLVWIYMYIRRLGYISQNRIDPDRINTPEVLTAALPAAVNAPSNNLKNLFELPVIFYAVCLFLATTEADATFVNLAWVYVVLRAIHSLIHCTINLVTYRFLAYLLSSLVLWAMVIRSAMIFIRS
jgi:hypothetical protein